MRSLVGAITTKSSAYRTSFKPLFSRNLRQGIVYDPLDFSTPNNFLFVETCFGSLHPFGLGISVFRSLLQPYPLYYRKAFAFSYILCPLSLPPFSRLDYHFILWSSSGLPSFLCSTFFRALREVFSPGCATDDKGTKKNRSYLATYLLVSAYQPCFADL